MIQRVTTSDTTSDKEWQRMIDNEWQWVVISANFTFFGIIEEPNIKHFKENSLKLAEDLEDGILD